MPSHSPSLSEIAQLGDRLIRAALAAAPGSAARVRFLTAAAILDPALGASDAMPATVSDLVEAELALAELGRWFGNPTTYAAIQGAIATLQLMPLATHTPPEIAMAETMGISHGRG